MLLTYYDGATNDDEINETTKDKSKKGAIARLRTWVRFASPQSVLSIALRELHIVSLLEMCEERKWCKLHEFHCVSCVGCVSQMSCVSGIRCIV